MNAKRTRREVWVRRITVDEKLADDLFRFLICSLAENISEFSDHPGEWGKERETLARPDDYYRKLGIPLTEAPQWETLEEGQVFLSGEFEEIRPENAEDWSQFKSFRTSRGKKQCMRIDQLDEFRATVRKRYSDALPRRLRDGKGD